MKTLDQTIFGRALGWLADVVTRHRWLFLWPQIFLFGACLLYAWFNLKFDPSRNNLVGAGKTYHQNFLKFKQEFPSQDDLVVVVESENPAKNRQFVERLGAKMAVQTNLFMDVLFRNDFKMLGRKALLFVPEPNLKELRGTLKEYLPFIERFTKATNLDSMFEMVNSQFLHGRAEASRDPQAINSLIKAMPMLDRLTREATDSLRRSGTPPSPGLTALFGAGEEKIYITFATNRIYLVTAQPPSKKLNGDALARLRGLVTQTQREVPGLNVGITGESVLEHDEMQQSQHDSIVASLVSLVVCALIFIYGYQQTGRPLKATFCLLVGLGYTLAFTALTVGHLNILTITFMPILIGLAIDFGVHLITRYEEELRLGRSEEAAMRTAMVFTGQGIFTGALTTAVAFLAMGLTKFQGIQEMGVICGGGMLICLVPMLTLLPVLLFRGTQNVIDHQQAGRPELRARIENLWLRRPVWVAAITAVLCGLALTQFRKVYFDYDLLNMQANGLPAVVFEKKLVQSKSVLFAAVVADSAPQAVELERRLRQLPAVAVDGVDSMASRLVGDQSRQLELIRQIKQDIAPVQFAPPDRSPVILSNLSLTLYGTLGFLGAAAEDLETAQPPDFRGAEITRLDALVARLKSPGKDDRVSQFLAGQLADQTRQLLSETNAAAQAQWEARLVADLNRIITQGAVYEAQRFQGVSLSAKTAEALADHPAGTNLVRLNRWLLLDAYPDEMSALSKQLLDLRGSVFELRKHMLNGDDSEHEAGARKLAAFQQALFDDVHDTFAAFQEQDDRAGLKVEDLPPALRHRFIGVTGKHLLMVYPRKDVWQHDNQKEFVEELRTVVPNVTGTPVQLLEYTALLKDSYVQAAWYALGAIILMVLVHFRTVGSVFLALLPVAVGSVWLGGLMGWFNIPFNPANIMTLPLVIGIGVTNGIQILNRFAEEEHAGILAKSTGKAVFVSGLTTFSGFGSLMLAKHQGIRSLGEVMAMGVALCMIAGLTVLPAVLSLMLRWRGKTAPASAETNPSSGDPGRPVPGREEPR